jgi:hypothetical protein
LIADFEFLKLAWHRVAKLDRVGSVALHFRLVRNGNDHGLYAGHRAVGNRNFFCIRLQGRDHAKNSAPSPLESFGLLLFREIALGHNDHLQRRHRFPIFGNRAAGHDAIAFRYVGKRHVSRVGQGLFAWREFFVGRPVVNRDRDGRTGGGCHCDLLRGHVNRFYLTDRVLCSNVRVRALGEKRQRDCK